MQTESERWGMMNTCFTDEKQIKKYTKTVLRKECTSVQKYINESVESFDSTQDNDPNFSSSFFHEGPIVNVKTVEEGLKEMNLHKVRKKENICHIKNMT